MEKQTAIDKLNSIKEASLQMGGTEKIEQQHQRGRLTARERINRLFDPETFDETGMLMQNPIPDSEGRTTHISKVRGFGKVNGRTVMVNADDATVAPGTGRRMGFTQQTGLNPALYPELCFPLITLADGNVEQTQTTRTAAGMVAPIYTTDKFLTLRRVPHVVAIMGDCYGPPAWQAAAADFVVMVKGSHMAICEPGLEITPDGTENSVEPGSCELHEQITGQVDAIAEDEEQAMQIIRDFLSYMPANCDEEPPYVPTDDPVDRKGDRLMRIIPDKANRVYDMYQVIRTIVDDGKYLPVKKNFAATLITCLARMDGRTIGIVANQTLYKAGAAGPDECDKASDFIVMCDTFNIPIIFLTDTPGFLVGKPAEQKKMPTKIIMWMQTLAFSTVPKICIIVRKAYGMAISNMCGTNCGPDFIAALTTSEISFMSPEAAANVVFLNRIESADDPEAEREKLIKEMAYQSEPWAAAAVGLLDDVIDPRETREYIIGRLDILRGCKGNFISDNKLQAWPTGF
ncbi:MAG TPA: hypothetical protein G4O07_07820 [Dehalococcoidia bacterium]|nr:hypothetical protein [Dehalococcoidia bacterium]